MPTAKEILYPWALTTQQRLKDLIDPSLGSQFDPLLIRLANAVTDFVKAQTNGRDFQLKQHIEVSSVTGALQKTIIVRQRPIFYKILQGSVSQGGSTLTLASGYDTGGIAAGMAVISLDSPLGPGGAPLPYSPTQPTVSSIVAGTSITITIPFTGTSSTATIAVVGVTGFFYRAGVVSNPSWTPFIPDQFEVVDDGRAGIIRVYGVLPRLYNNMIQTRYWGGYLIDFDNFGNTAYHDLPADLTRCAENIAVKWFKRRDWAGKQSQTLEGSTISFRDKLDYEDLEVLNFYKRVPPIM